VPGAPSRNWKESPLLFFFIQDPVSLLSSFASYLCQPHLPLAVAS
jgi:hypothetical protein